jgi:phage/plasmid-associated DNA primase
MRRRTHLVPFTVTPRVVDNELSAKLKAEWPAILGWLVQGCLEWQKTGLKPPPVVMDATDDYFDESDPLSQWIDECCVRGGDEMTPLLTLWDSWMEWAGRRGEYKGKIQKLSQMLETRMFVKDKDSKTRRVLFKGLTVNTLKECKGRFSVANNRADSAAIAANSSACAWYLGSEWRYK